MGKILLVLFLIFFSQNALAEKGTRNPPNCLRPKTDPEELLKKIKIPVDKKTGNFDYVFDHDFSRGQVWENMRGLLDLPENYYFMKIEDPKETDSETFSMLATGSKLKKSAHVKMVYKNCLVASVSGEVDYSGKHYEVNDPANPANQLSELKLPITENKDTHYNYDIKRFNLTQEQIEQNFESIFGLGEDHELIKFDNKSIPGKPVNNGVRYDEFYKDIPVEGGVVFFDAASVPVPYIICSLVKMPKGTATKPKIGADEAVDLVKKHLNISVLDKNYPPRSPELLFANNGNGDSPYRLAYKIGVNRYEAYVDAITGEIMRAYDTAQTSKGIL